VSDDRLPLGLRQRSDRDAIIDDLGPYIGTTMEQRDEIMSQLCRFASEQIAAHPDPQRILDFQDPLSPASEALWRRLIAEAARP
jgi:hypothetical protein